MPEGVVLNVVVSHSREASIIIKSVPPLQGAGTKDTRHSPVLMGHYLYSPSRNATTSPPARSTASPRQQRRNAPGGPGGVDGPAGGGKVSQVKSEVGKRFSKSLPHFTTETTRSPL